MFWEILTDDERRLIEEAGGRRSYPKGTVLLLEEDRPTHVVVLLQGLVKLTKAAANGRQVLIELRGPGALIGELSGIDESGRSATVTAISPVEAIVVPTERFRPLLRSHAGISYAVLVIVADKLRQATDRRLDSTGDAVGQLAGRLVELALAQEPDATGAIRIHSPLTQEELAEWIGTSRDAVVLALRKMRASGWIETGRRTILINDLDALRRRATE